MTESNDPYVVLGIDRNAERSDVKKAYRSLAQKYHPDKSEGDEKMFYLIQWAHDLLMDEGRRASYDATGRDEGKSVDSMAYDMLVQIMMKVMLDGFEGDVIQGVHTLLVYEHKMRTKQRDECRDKLDRVKGMYGRVSGGRAFDDAIESAEMRAQHELDKWEHAFTVTSQAFAMLEAYRDEYPNGDSKGPREDLMMFITESMRYQTGSEDDGP